MVDIEFKLPKNNTTLVEKGFKDHGDGWIIMHFSDGTSIKVLLEYKGRAGSGTEFRPKCYDVKRCIDKDIPMILFQNTYPKNEIDPDKIDRHQQVDMVVLRREDLIKITKECKTYRSPDFYNGARTYYYVKNYRPFMFVHLSDAKPLQSPRDTHPLETYDKMLKYIIEVFKRILDTTNIELCV